MWGRPGRVRVPSRTRSTLSRRVKTRLGPEKRHLCRVSRRAKTMDEDKNYLAEKILAEETVV